jgi:hypothetical protein
VSKEVGNKGRPSSRSVRSVLSASGRVAIWVAIGLLLVRGLGAVLVPAPEGERAPKAGEAATDPASAALAVRFARAYLDNPAPRALAPFLAEGVRVGGGRAPEVPGAQVAQAALNASRELGDGKALLTVACDLRDRRVVSLVIPISRSGAGEVAVSGAPWVVAAPSVGGVEAERPRPLVGSDAASIRALVAKFLPAYLAARSTPDLSYLLAPGAAVVPLAGALEPLGAAGSVAQLGDGKGPRRTVLASGRFRDPVSGAVYRLAYRLELVRRSRWYVRSVEGAQS